MNIVEVENVSKTFKDKKEIVKALDGVNLKIEGDQIFGLLGPNGAGKSTLLNILSTTLLPSQGRAFVLGMDTSKQSREIVQKIGLVRAGARFYWDFNSYSILNYYGMMFGLKKSQRKEKIELLSKQLGFKDYIKTKFYNLSTGMRQKVAIAKSLLNDPEVLFMDEPTAGLDVEISIGVRNFLRDLVKERKILILITSHDMHEIEVMSKKIALIDRGKLVKEGDISRIKKELNFPDTIFLSLSSYEDLDFLNKIENVRKVERNDAGIFIEVYDAAIEIEKIIDGLKKRKIKIEDMEIRKASLEEAFLKIVGENGV